MTHTSAVSLVPGSQCDQAEGSTDFGLWVQLLGDSRWVRCIVWLWMGVYCTSTTPVAHQLGVSSAGLFDVEG